MAVRICPRAPNRYKLVFLENPVGTPKGRAKDFLGGLQGNSPNPAPKGARFCFGGGGSSQRLFWQQPFYSKGCYPMRFFPYPEPRLSIFASVRANVSAFVDYEIFLLPATFSRKAVWLFQYDKLLFPHLGLNIHLKVAGASL